MPAELGQLRDLDSQLVQHHPDRQLGPRASSNSSYRPAESSGPLLPWLVGSSGCRGQQIRGRWPAPVPPSDLPGQSERTVRSQWGVNSRWPIRSCRYNIVNKILTIGCRLEVADHRPPLTRRDTRLRFDVFGRELLAGFCPRCTPKVSHKCQCYVGKQPSPPLLPTKTPTSM